MQGKIESLQSSESWRRIEEQFLETGRTAEAQAGLTQAVDAVALKAWRGSFEPLLPQSAAMLALGPFGRREIYPHSGVDILILLEDEPEPGAMREAVSEFIRPLWDAGVRLNHSIRTMSDCLELREQHMDFVITLLDRRLLAGDREMTGRFESKLQGFLSRNAPKLRQRLCQLARTRHNKSHNTPCHVEPDVQYSPGGLRDLRLMTGLTALGVAQPEDVARLEPHRLHLAGLRCFLHYHNGSDRNGLDVEAQEAYAALPFVRKSRHEWMREHYERARAVFHEARRLLDLAERSEGSLIDNLREYRSKLSNADFTVTRDRIFLRNPGMLESDPMTLFRLLEFIARHGVAPAAETERRLETSRAAVAAFAGSQRPLWDSWKSVLSCPHAALALRTLENAGILPAALPEWSRIEGEQPAGTDEKFTLDEHTLQACERLGELRSATEPARQRFGQLLSEIDNPALLRFALLYHRMGEVAGKAAERMHMPQEEQRDAEFLIARQRDLAETLSRDVDDPAATRTLADRVGTVERLKLLTLLTYADISATSPEAMTPWRMERLWHAYQLTQHELTRELETDRIRELPEALAGRAEFVRGFPVRYLRAHSPAEIESHMQLYELSRPTGAAVRIEVIEGAFRLTVVARDRPSLFASFAGAISSFGLDILKAEAFSNGRGVILDTFVFADPKRMLQLNPSEMERLEDLIRRVAMGKTDAQRLMRAPASGSVKRSIAPEVQFDSEACEAATLVEIVAEDRPGLLYSLASVFSSSACNIDVVLIDTKGKRAIDVFYVAHEGRKLSPDMQQRLKEKLLAVC